jgi:CRISPR-associated protein Csm4
MQLQSWSIYGRSFHFGLHGIGQEETSLTMPSDSLFAALVARLARAKDGSAVDQFCQPFLTDSPPFLLTSTFPLAGKVRFFPPPLSARKPPEKMSRDPKALKKVAFVSENLYNQLLSGTLLAELADVRELQGGKAWISNQEFSSLPGNVQKENKFWEMDQRPRVALDRASQASNLFFTGQANFARDCGLWFGVRWLSQDAETGKQIKALLADLADAGLGAERSAGLGVADIQESEVLELPDPQEKWTNLSRYLPRADEVSALDHKDSAYGLKQVGGWLDSPARPGQRRRTVNLITEGSVFGHLLRPYPGQVVDVRPMYKDDVDPLKHPVYRSGLALAVGMEGGQA